MLQCYSKSDCDRKYAEAEAEHSQAGQCPDGSSSLDIVVRCNCEVRIIDKCALFWPVQMKNLLFTVEDSNVPYRYQKNLSHEGNQSHKAASDIVALACEDTHKH